MKFNEKLMELRKKEGLSQEELGYKLNVTRQTVSKWELGQTTPEMDKLVEMSKIFNISVDELVNNVKISNSEEIYKESSIEKNNKKISIRIFIIGLIISVILCGIGLIRQNNVKKTNEGFYNEAYALSAKKYNAAMERVDKINVELKELNSQKEKLETEKNSLTMGSNNWISETSRLATEIYNLSAKVMDLEAEKSSLLNDDYTVYYTPVKSINYLIFYYIGAGVFAVSSLIALIYYLVTRKK